MKRVAVLGGGISGLAAAWQLLQAEPHPHITLFESSGRVGGVLETIQAGPYLIEKGADNFATLVPDALDWSRACGLEEQLIQPAKSNRKAFVLNRGRLLPIPAGFSLMQPTRISSILQTKTLSWAGKLRLAKEYWIPARDTIADESLESFVVRRLGREVFERLVEPIVSGIFTADPSTLSMQATMPQFVKMEQEHGGLIRGHLAARQKDALAAARKASGARYDQFTAPKSGMSDWVAALAAQLPSDCIQLNQRVTELRPAGKDSSRWVVTTERESLEFDAVIGAIPAAPAAELLRATLPAGAELLDQVPYASSVVAALVVNRADITRRMDGFGMIVPSREGRVTLAISYSSEKYAGRTPKDEILLRVFMGGALHPQMIEKSDAELEKIAATELREILGWTGRLPNWQAIIRWNKAMPQYLVGHVERMQQLNQVLESYPTLRLCGAAYQGVGIPQCVRGGQQAAREVLASLAEDK
ncbi:protoporphyrinogen oxidase [Aureliella helgolandensis]|uniref:Coproporphyrinogen III oxidase n=1 Tax=Aureliella helgolandensis TaxID=2527968 RepID=A0A518G008_9BACT|nr:protoporphyrinogen oxidase [Aureliella helgolandensis]QDV21947.1 Protoporphyrinogen oxidase [Aureliella helgolandensis]